MGELVGRDDELRQALLAVDRLVSGHRAVALVLEGEAGIGKTALLEAIQSQAAANGMTVLRASPVESEAPMEFTALADLLEAVDVEALASLPPPQRHALDVALLRAEPGNEGPHPRAVAVATLTVLRELAERGPVLLTIDDLAWLDRPSADVVSFVLRRRQADRLGLITAIRTGWVATDVALPTDGLADDQTIQLSIGPLDELAIRQVLIERGCAPDDRAAFDRLYAASGGVPLFAVQLAASPDLAAGTSLQGSLRRLLAGRLGTLSPRARELLLVAAASDDGAIDVVLDALSDREGYRVDLDLAASSGLISFDDQTIRFAHPMVRSTILDEAGVVPVREAHRRLANVARRPESRARHLGLGADGASDRVASQLDEAAATAASRGAPATAADLAELAVELTPRSDRATRSGRLHLAARYRFEAADPGRAGQLIERAIADLEPGPTRAAALIEQTKYLRYLDRPTATWIDLLRQALHEAGDDLRVAADTHRDLAMAAANAGDPLSGLKHCDVATELAVRLGDDDLLATMAAGEAYVRFAIGEGIREDLLATALANLNLPDDVEMANRPAYVCGLFLMWAGDLARANALFAVESERLTKRTGEIGQPQLLWCMSSAALLSGDWDRAEELAEIGCRDADLIGSPSMRGLVTITRGLVHAHRGRIDEARADADFVIEMGQQIQMPQMSVFGLEALGFLLLSMGDHAAAHECLEPLVAPLLAGITPDPGMCRFAPDDIEALVRLGDLDGAQARLDVFSRRADELNRSWAQGAAARCEALLLAARGDMAGATAAADRALARLEPLGMPFDLARASLVSGEIHRRARRKALARDHITAALETFERLGAPLWAARARAELASIGLRPPGPSADNSLTERERQIADLAVRGRSNQGIAATLFMSVRTVESHLTRVYRKLGVNSRTELASRLLNTETTEA